MSFSYGVFLSCPMNAEKYASFHFLLPKKQPSIMINLTKGNTIVVSTNSVELTDPSKL